MNPERVGAWWWFRTWSQRFDHQVIGNFDSWLLYTTMCTEKTRKGSPGFQITNLVTRSKKTATMLYRVWKIMGGLATPASHKTVAGLIMSRTIDHQCHKPWTLIPNLIVQGNMYQETNKMTESLSWKFVFLLFDFHRPWMKKVIKSFLLPDIFNTELMVIGKWFSKSNKSFSRGTYDIWNHSTINKYQITIDKVLMLSLNRSKQRKGFQIPMPFYSSEMIIFHTQCSTIPLFSKPLANFPIC